MFGSPQAYTLRPPSRTPSLLSLVRKNELQPQTSTSNQLSNPESVDTRLAGMGLHSPQMSPPTRSGSLSSMSTASSSGGQRPNGLIRHRHRAHIYDNIHKAKVKRDRQQQRAQMVLQAYERQKRHGYLSYFDRVITAVPHDPNKVLSPLADDGPLSRAIAIARASMQEYATVSPLRPPIGLTNQIKSLFPRRKPLKFDTSALDILQHRWRQKDAQLEEDLKKPKFPPVPSSLPPADEGAVQRFLEKRGTIVKYARESVEDKDLNRLRPGQWLNDEIINFYGAMILGRSEGCKENKENVPNVSGKKELNGVAKGRGKPLNVHYFSSFFWTKLTTDGYDKGRLAKWTKKIDIFSKDVILIPVNHNNAHWTAAAINFRRKRIESYDSMGMAKDIVFMHLRKYLDAEHRNKKKAPFDFTEWKNYAPDELTPQQENGFDCGVYTCAFLEALSRGEESFRFTQKDMPYMRRRMIWEIGNTKLRDD
ncbi:Sentrin-specific protease 1 [Leucoagaricus sp. SymC.cos]|nr:Sentrin-specific protease 1 [Leucoagaricus sp. SymC.cos]